MNESRPPGNNSRVIKLAVGCGTIGVAAVVFWLVSRTPKVVLPPRSVETTQSKRDLDRLERPQPPASGYVGNDACRRCHPKIYESYQTHPMAMASADVLDAAVCEDYVDKTAFRQPGGRVFSVERTESSVSHHFGVTDDEGPVFDQSIPITLAIGSGKRGRAYALAHNGRLFESPVTWYSERKRWDLSPGYSANNRLFERRLTGACLNCHAGRLARKPDEADVFQDRPLLEGAISCERCHGPGEQHVAWHDNPQKLAGPDPIVNPTGLSPRLRESVCSQCHLQGHDRVLRYGRQPQDFRPGQDLSDIWVVFVRGDRVTADGSTQAVSQVEQMRSSVCYQQSERKMGCTSCHDPHSAPNSDERADFYRAKCRACHVVGTNDCSEARERRLAPTVRDSCIQCHMPSLSASDVPHTSQSDHRVLRRRNETGVAADEGSIVVFDNADQRLPRVELVRARGLMLSRDAETKNDAFLAEEASQLLTSILPAVPDDVKVLDALGITAQLRGQHDAAKRHWQAVLAIDPRHEGALANLATLAHRHGEFDEGIQYLRRLLAINSWNGRMNGRLAHMLSKRNDPKGAASAARRALEVDPMIEQARSLLMQLHGSLGRKDEAEQQRRILERLDKLGTE